MSTWLLSDQKNRLVNKETLREVDGDEAPKKKKK